MSPRSINSPLLAECCKNKHISAVPKIVQYRAFRSNRQSRQIDSLCQRSKSEVVMHEGDAVSLGNIFGFGTALISKVSKNLLCNYLSRSKRRGMTYSHNVMRASRRENSSRFESSRGGVLGGVSFREAPGNNNMTHSMSQLKIIYGI